MKKIIFILLLCFFSHIFVSNPITTFATPNNPALFEAIDFPLSDVTDTFTKNIFTQIDTLFGSAGLNLEQPQINVIKKTYLYLIFLTKLEKVQSDTKFKLYQADFAQFLKDNNSQMPHIPTQKLVTSAGWNLVSITTQDIVLSTPWQLYCKSMICDIYVYFCIALKIIHNVEKQTFNYIPHFETSFYNQDYTDLRTINEITRTKLDLELKVKQRYINACPSWSILGAHSSNAPQASTSLTLEQAIVNFRQTQFYKITHDMHVLLGTEKNKNNITVANQNLLTLPQQQSPLKEYTWCYFMIKEVYDELLAVMHYDNLEAMLETCGTIQFLPNIFPYKPDDFILLHEILAAKSKAEGNHANSPHPSPKNFKIEQLRAPEHLINNRSRDYSTFVQEQADKTQTVQAQSFLSFFRDLGHDIAKGFDDVKNAVEKAADAAWDFTKSVGQGIAGIGAETVGLISEDSKIYNWGRKETERAQANLNATTTDLDDSVADFAKSLQDGFIAPTAELTGSIVGFVTQDKKLGADISTVIDEVGDTLSDVATSIVNATINFTMLNIKVALQAVQVTETFAKVVVDAVWAIWSKKGREEFLKDGEQLGKDCLHAIVMAYKGLVNSGKTVMDSVITGLGVIVNSLTTLFIDLVREITFLAAGGIFDTLTLGLANDIPGLNKLTEFAKESRSKVTNSLNEHRQTINQVMGVAVAIATDIAVGVATAGTGEAAAIAADSAIIGASTVAETAATTAATTVAETAATTTAETVAETAAETAAETTSEAATEGATEVSEEAGEQSLTEIGGKSIFETSEETAEEGAEESADTEEAAEEAAQGSKSVLSKAKLIGMALNVGFGLFNAIGGYNQDEQALAQEENQEKSLQDLWNFINQNKLSTAQQEVAFLQEFQAKQQAELGNQTLGLALYQNQNYAAINQFQEQITGALAPLYLQLLTPDPNTNLKLADIGSSWGIDTNYLDLYPSEGFFSTTTGRPDFPFAQEIAQAPQAITKLIHRKKTTEPDKADNWFNQKTIALDLQDTNGSIKKPLDPLTVSINLQLIYTLNSEFYVGLYLGGNFYNFNSNQYLAQLLKVNIAKLSETLAAIQTNYLSKQIAIPSDLFNVHMIDLDIAYLAKMLVLYREHATDNLHLGVYEHEGSGWILRQLLPDALQLDRHHNYTLTATLNGSNMTIALLVDNNLKPVIQKTVTVSPIQNQRTYGVICSSAAIAWNQITPEKQIIVNGAVRSSTKKLISEIDREKTSKKQLALAQKPTFGTTSLQAISKQAILFGQYIYATTDTGLQKITPKSPADFVIFATMQQGNISNIGQNPAIEPPAGTSLVLISLITGTVYDSSQNSIATMAHVFEQYAKTHGPFSPKLIAYIKKQQMAVQQALSKISFGKFALNIMNPQALQYGQYIYTSTQTITTPQAMTDYLVMTEINNNSLGSLIGMAPTAKNAQGLLSLVTGNLYAKNTVFSLTTPPKPLTTYLASAQFGAYLNQVNVSSADQSKILSAQTSYQASQTTAQVPPAPKFKIIPLQNTTPDAVAGIHLPLNGFHIGLLPSAPGVHLEMLGKGNLSDRQKHAAGPAGFQLGPPPVHIGQL